VMTTRAPSRANASAVAFPIPLLPPVMTAVRPVMSLRCEEVPATEDTLVPRPPIPRFAGRSELPWRHSGT
jgi:hypothetical protein